MAAGRFYLQNAAPGYTPSTRRGTWKYNNTFTGKLDKSKGGTLTSRMLAETASTSGRTTHLLTMVSDPLPANKAISGTANLVFGALSFAPGNVSVALTGIAPNPAFEALAFVEPGIFNVLDYGAKGDGTTDDTAAINAAVAAANAAGGGTVYVPDGIYKIPMKAYTNINLLSNVKLLLADNAVIKGHYDSANYDYNHAVIRIRDRTNVEISGGTIKGFKQERDVHNEVGHGIAIQGSNYVHIHDIKSCWNDGDGIFIGTSASQLYSGNVLIEDFICEYNNRQGITLESGRNVTIKNGECRYQYGSYPMTGIDIEPIHNSWYVDNILFDNVKCYENGVDYPHASYCYGIEIGFGWWHANGGNTNGTPISLKISNCRLYNNGNADGYQINTNHIPVYLANPAMNIDYITLENNSYEAEDGGEQYPLLTNLVANPSFSGNNFTGWTSGSLSSRTIDNGGDGYRAAIVASAQYGRLYQTISGLIVGHQYYFRATMLAPSTASVFCGMQGKTFLWVNQANTEEVLSTIYTATATSHVVQWSEGRASGFDAFYGDRMMLVDLDAAYGTNIPDIAVCDAWPFFEGTYMRVAGIPPAASIGTPTITTAGLSEQNVQPLGIGASIAVGNLVILPGNTNLIIGGVPSGAVAGSPVLQPGAVAVALGGIASGSLMGTLTVALGNANLQLSGIPSGIRVGAPAVAPGAVVVSLPGIAPVGQLGSPKVTFPFVPLQIALGLLEMPLSLAQSGRARAVSLAEMPLSLAQSGRARAVSLAEMPLILEWKAINTKLEVK